MQHTNIQKIQTEINLLIARQRKTRFYIFLGGIGVPLSITLLGLSDITTRAVIMSTTGLLVISISTILISLLIYKISRDEMIVFMRIKKLIDRTADIIQNRQDIYAILSIIEEVYASLNEKYIFSHYIQIDQAYSSTGPDTRILRKRLSVWTDIVLFYTTLLYKLRSDMFGEIEKHKKELNMGITTLQELSTRNDGVQETSELQQNRLDRQIKQFEELQKVLVKV